MALAAAFMVAIYIAVDSGVLGGEEALDTGDGETATSKTATDEIEPAEEPSGYQEEEPSGESMATETTDGGTYKVQSGDSFSTIAQKFDTSIAEIQELNPDVNPQNLTVGMELKVP